MAVIGFQQDPGAPDGAGMFEFDDGRPPAYAHDPDLARSLHPDIVAAAQPGPDQRMAGPGAPGEPPMSNEQALDAMGKMRFGNPEAAAQVDARAQAAQPQPAGPAKPPADVIQPEAPTNGGAPSEYDRNVQQYLLGQAKKQGAPRPEAWVPKTRAETIETEGVPYSPEDAAIRIRANQDVVAAKGATAAMLQERAMNDLASAKAAQPVLMQKAAEAQKALDEQHAAYMADRAELQRAMDVSNSSPGSQSEWFANKSVLAKIIMILGQGFGAYAGIKSGTGRNWAQEAIQGVMESDIAQQKEQAKHGVDNALKRMELRYKDRDQAEAALRLAQGNILNNVQAMHAAANQAQNVQAAHQEMLAENQANMVAQEQKFQNAAFGKHSIKVDTAHQAASGGGAFDPLTLVKRLIDSGMPKEEAWRHVFGEGGGRSRADAINRENVATFEGQSREFENPEARKRATEAMPELTGMEQKARELKAILARGALDPKMKARAKALASQLSIAYGPAFSGSKRVNEYEVQAGQDTFGHLSDSILSGATTDLLGRSQAAIDTVLEHTAARKKELLEGSYRVSPKLGTNASGQRERQYNYQTQVQGEDVE